MSSFDEVSTSKFDYWVKITIVGDSGVGKTALLTRYVDQKFEDNAKATIGIDQKHKIVYEKKQCVKINFCDTAGQERFHSLAQQTFKRSHGVIVVYDVTHRKSFDNLEKWFTSIENNCDENVVVMLVGNKTDLEEKREVTIEEASKFAQEKNTAFFETSALNNNQVDQSFNEIIKRALENIIREDEKAEEMELKKLQESTIQIRPYENVEPLQKRSCC